jgi:hypothetical protein
MPAYVPLVLLQYGTHYAGYVRNLNAGLATATTAGVKLASTDLTSEQQPQQQSQQQYKLPTQHTCVVLMSCP